MEESQANTPILIGVGQMVARTGEKKAANPIAMMTEAARLACADSGADLLAHIDCVAITRFITDAPDMKPIAEKASSKSLPGNEYKNPPKSLAQALGATPNAFVYGPPGGNTPQWLVNLMAERICQGTHQLVLLAGSECMHRLVKMLKSGTPFSWIDELTADGMEDLGSNDPLSSTKSEAAHGLHLPINAYPLFENAIRKHYRRSISEHQKALGALMAPFTKIAAGHPQAWFPVQRSADEIATPSDNNRYIGFPYTKYMNAIMQVDQSAALLMTNVATAQRLGVPREKWIFLHGCGDVNDIWFVSERKNYHTSPAIKRIGESAFDMAGWSVDDIDFIDLYSCFPSAVQIGSDALGIKQDDPRGLTVTGGLPYFGGCGNNYAMHSIATMAEKLRAKPGSKGLCTANGWYVTKHSIGLYSTEPVVGAWERTPSKSLQADIDAEKHPEAIAAPDGDSVIETYTVLHGRKGVEHGVMIGLTAEGKRFCARIDDPKMRDRLMTEDCLGMAGQVKSAGSQNVWTPKA